MPGARTGGISFIQRFGAKLNFHPHFHLCFADGVFVEKNGELHFFNALIAPDDVQDAEDRIRQRVLKLFQKERWLSHETIEEMLNWANSGFSLDASIRIDAWDQSSLERLIRYCARPPFASENLKWNYSWLEYRLSKPSHDGVSSIQFTTDEFFDRLEALIPPPRRHRHHYHGVFAPNAPMRKRVTSYAKKRLDEPKEFRFKKTTKKIRRVSLDWAEMISRIYEDNPLLCQCGEKMKIVAFVTCPFAIRRILGGLGLSTKAPGFDHVLEVYPCEMNQLVLDTEDGFPVENTSKGFPSFDIGPDPPYTGENHLVDISDGFLPDIDPLPSHWEENIQI